MKKAFWFILGALLAASVGVIAGPHYDGGRSGATALPLSGGTMAGNINMGGYNITNKGQNNYDVVSYDPTGTTQAVDWDYSMVKLDLGAASGNMTLTFINADIGDAVIIYVVQSATARTITWPTVKWPAGGAAPVISPGNDAIDEIVCKKIASIPTCSFNQDFQ
jgi:hypothetical protein